GLVDIDAAGCEQTATLARSAGGRARAFAVDVSNREALLDAAARFAGEHQGLDAVINNAMLLRYEPVSSISEAVADQMLGIGIKGAIWGTQAL
ncbi:SDR family NAD(P)-dependent oxidoreductase, partial [Enterococcus faecium]|uniref:SDR family NAD(P)-dependent oxidoreductase n=1 Tax=Enterococcus faecium TaxID=1352 RepID=UPI003F4317D3